MLKGVDPVGKGHHESEPAAKDEIERYRSQLAKLRSLLYVEKKRSILIVLQSMDAGGKDGVVNHVLSALNPQGARVNGFRRPTMEEAAHDFLWRVHPHTPARGETAIFNRPHYEDVLVPRVHKLIDKPAWEARYLRIRDFEDGLADNGTRILKFFLHLPGLLSASTIRAAIAIGRSASPIIPNERTGTHIWPPTKTPSVPRAASARHGS
jgi:polyphosphate kinase 2 (PPK2 family)